MKNFIKFLVVSPILLVFIVFYILGMESAKLGEKLLDWIDRL